MSLINMIQQMSDSLDVKMHISEAKFLSAFPKSKPLIYHEIAKYIGLAGCKTKEQQAMFLAQCGHETAGFSAFSENLNYSDIALLRTFPKYFNTGNVKAYARQPEKIANRAYANRMGNGNEQSGDGYKFRGRGLVQITGKNNYVLFRKWLGREFKLDDVGTDLELIVLAGVWYWQKNNLAALERVVDVTKRVNGGLNGLADRQAKYDKLMS
ncbi:glycoside hydrolase family 19 protein [Actinobacillus pleuropneumoniae]|uniref:glycoside hydrolase family 19 protein n=1 Tax=Actinobacillus pleuropneumoniae TaxID=715 RepID=UPI0022787687|nr:glycoside hydrolase family 19 protein [Actinobacillus pleuropneumoniae]MCY6396684.1 glycoside hydrolase family 19 protein [Actinobacillus pleuropneumoniae]MCY6410484.1 glycoside hydrolase family 19 protein [Actinobacillus pleuropneumoniae]